MVFYKVKIFNNFSAEQLTLGVASTTFSLFVVNQTEFWQMTAFNFRSATTENARVH